MEFLGRYASAVTAGAVLCSVLLSFTRTGSHHTLLRFLCGVCFAVILIRPFADRNWKWDPGMLRSAVDYGKQQAQMGADLSRDAISEGISRRLEEYILEKAASLDASLSVTVTLREDLRPETVHLRGRCTHRAKEELSRMMEQDLAIAKENQIWTG